METNRNQAQECTAQLINPSPSCPESDAQTAQERSVSEQLPLYDPAKALRIAECLRELLEPEFILLFGTLAQGTPHSQTACYDLLVLVDGTPRYHWFEAKRYLKMKMPNIGHGAPYVNIYILTRHDVEANFTPFTYLTRREGVVLYAKYGQQFKRPRSTFDFGHAASEAQRYSGVFLPLADQLAEYAGRTLDWKKVRLSAFTMAQAAVYYYRTLFYVYHGFEAETCDVEVLQHRLRTLSGELMLVFESNANHPMYTLPCLKSFLERARYDPRFFIRPAELVTHLDRVTRFGEIVNKLCMRRIDLYKELTEIQ